jgi:CRISPR/Cas system Type II protein with McrA/HNH and RuvC-like nuclease domain
MSAVLVLNSDYTPLNVTTLQRGFVLVDKGKAEVIKKGENDIVTTIGNFVRPLVIRLLNYIKFRPKTIKVNRKRIFKRDGYSCQYCGSKKNLTIDHVMPRSRGGLNSWKNMVTCCFRCNSYKGDKTPQEAGMTLKTKPYEPNIFSHIIDDEIEMIWDSFKKSFY